MKENLIHRNIQFYLELHIKLTLFISKKRNLEETKLNAQRGKLAYTIKDFISSKFIYSNFGS